MQELTSEESEELRRDLLALQGELRNTLETSQEAARPVDLEQPIGRVSRADAIQQQKMLQANRRAMQGRIQQVRAALERFAQEEYGACLDCGESVGFARLKARPETPFCIACQTRRERRS